MSIYLRTRNIFGGEKLMKKLFALLTSITLLVCLIPGVALASGGVPAGLTLQNWVVGPNQGGKNTTVEFYYSGGYSTGLEVDIQYNSSWQKIDPVEPIFEAYKEGYGPNLGSAGGILGTTISFAPNVLAAMKVQDFNPSQVGGANIPPSSTTLTSDQIAWLQKIGYSVQTTSQSSPTPTPTPSPTPAPVTQTQPQPQPISSQQPSQPTQTNASSGPAQKANTSSSKDPVTADPEVGKTVKTPVKTATPETIAAAKKFATENPPSLNPTNIPINIPTKNAKKEANVLENKWIWVAIGAILLILIGAIGRIIYIRRRAA